MNCYFSVHGQHLDELLGGACDLAHQLACQFCAVDRTMAPFLIQTCVVICTRRSPVQAEVFNVSLDSTLQLEEKLEEYPGGEHALLRSTKAYVTSRAGAGKLGSVRLVYAH
jgi:hypothetical protein